METRDLPTVLNANGSVTPDVNKTIHVTSQGSGRVVALNVRLGDYVNKGKVLLSIHSADLAGAFSDYQKAAADERLAKKGLDRAQLLYSRGAIAEKDLQHAEDTEEKAQVDVQNAEQHVRILAAILRIPAPLIELRAPISGTIVEQNIAGFEGVKSLDNTPNLFTIADLSRCGCCATCTRTISANVHLGDAAEIRLNAYPDRTLPGQSGGHLARARSQHAHGQSAHRTGESRRILAARDVRDRDVPLAKSRSRHCRSSHRSHSPARQGLGVPCRRSDKSFRRVEVQQRDAAEDHGLQQILSGVKPATRSSRTRCEFSTSVAEQGK